MFCVSQVSRLKVSLEQRDAHLEENSIKVASLTRNNQHLTRRMDMLTATDNKWVGCRHADRY